MKKKSFIILLSLFASFVTQTVKASPFPPPPIVIDTLVVDDLVLFHFNDGHWIPYPHVPSYPATGLIGKCGHNLYLYPLDEAQTVTVTLCNAEGTEVFSESVFLDSEIVEVSLPANLAGEYTLYYYIEDRRYRGNIDL